MVEIKLVKDISPGSGSSNPANFTVLNNKLYFTAYDATNGIDLWESDGTESGTKLVKDIFAGFGSFGGSFGFINPPANFTAFNNKLYFTTFDDTNGTELWESDGTEAGTKLLKDIFSGSGSFGSPGFLGPPTVRPNSSNPANLTVFNNKLYFTAYDDTNGTELWESDGTSDGTKLVKDILSGAGGSSPANLTVLNNKLYFTAYDDINGEEVWESDGTPEGTKLVKDIFPGSGSFGFPGFPGFTSIVRPNSSDPNNFFVFNNKLYFSANDGTNGRELFVLENSLPTSLDKTITATEDQTYSFSLADFPFSDVDSGDSLQSITLLSAPATGTLKRGDTVLDDAAIGDGLVISKDDIDDLSFTPAPNANGDNYASFSFSVSDGINSSATQTLTINVGPVNDAPTSDNRYLELAEGGTYNFDIDDFAFNDVDAEDDRLELKRSLEMAGFGEGVPVEEEVEVIKPVKEFGTKDSLQKVKIVALPEKGSLKLDGQAVTEGQEIAAADLNKLSYSPVDNENTGANEEFYAKIDFQVSDGTDYSGLYGIFFDVSAEADAPIIAEGETAEVSLDEDNSLELTLTATDADDDPISWSIKTAAEKGTVSIDENGKVTYEPNLNYNGMDTVKVEANDGKGNTDSITIKLNINPVNDAPTVASPIADQSAKPGDAFSFTLPQNSFSDVDGNSLTLSATLANDQPLPAWLQFDPTTGKFSGTPARGDAGQLTVKVTAKDQGELSASDEFVLSVSELPLPNPPAPGNPNPSSPTGGFAQPPSIKFTAGKPGKQFDGTPGVDRLVGTNNNDIFNGKASNDTANGKAGNDILRGQQGDDKLEGGSGDDLIRCGTGNDRANGGAGRDIIVGGLGRDVLIGGAGVDTFVFNNNLAFNTDLIVDFKVGEDLINLQPMLAKEIYAGATAQEKFERYVQLEQTSQGALIKIDSDGSGAGTRMASLALLQGVQVSSLTASSFVG
ncbi:MAG: ELWxxDGT repeat protein [Elainella sp.]